MVTGVNFVICITRTNWIHSLRWSEKSMETNDRKNQRPTNLQVLKIPSTTIKKKYRIVVECWSTTNGTMKRDSSCATFYACIHLFVSKASFLSNDITPWRTVLFFVLLLLYAGIIIQKVFNQQRHTQKKGMWMKVDSVNCIKRGIARSWQESM